MSDNVVSRFFELGAKEDIDGSWECFAEDGVWITSDGPEPGKTLRGQEIRDLIVQMNELEHQIRAQGMEESSKSPSSCPTATRPSWNGPCARRTAPSSSAASTSSPCVTTRSW